MLFDKDVFSKDLEHLLHIITHAEGLIERAENNENTQNLTQINKNLEVASKLLKSLYNQISANHMTWDEATLKKRKGDYDNIVTRYKSIQQRVELIRSERKFSF